MPSTWPGCLPIPPIRCLRELVTPRGDLLPYEIFETGIDAIFRICHICSVKTESLLLFFSSNWPQLTVSVSGFLV